MLRRWWSPRPCSSLVLGHSCQTEPLRTHTWTQPTSNAPGTIGFGTGSSGCCRMAPLLPAFSETKPGPKPKPKPTPLPPSCPQMSPLRRQALSALDGLSPLSWLSSTWLRSVATCRLPAHLCLVPLCHRALPRGQAHPWHEAGPSPLLWGCFCSRNLLTVVFFCSQWPQELFSLAQRGRKNRGEATTALVSTHGSPFVPLHLSSIRIDRALPANLSLGTDPICSGVSPACRAPLRFLTATRGSPAGKTTRCCCCRALTHQERREGRQD